MALDKLVDSTQLDTDLTSVANAIRTKGGTSASLSFPADFISAINAISGGGGNVEFQLGDNTFEMATGTFTTTSQGNTIVVPTGLNGTLLCTFADRVGGIANLVWPDDTTYTSQLIGWVQSAPSVLKSTASELKTVTRVNRSNNYTYYASGTSISIASNGNLTVKNTKADFIIMSGQTFKWMAIVKKAA